MKKLFILGLMTLLVFGCQPKTATNTTYDVTFEEEFGGNLQQQLDAGAATDFLDYTEAELIEILLNDPDPSERALADGALQERANEQY